MSKEESRHTLRWGVIGLGQFAAKWVNDVFSNYESDELNGNKVKHILKGVVSTSSKQKAEAFVDLLNKEATETPQIYESYEQLLNDSQIDIVYIAAPNAFHYPLAVQALKAKKHVLVEKTFTINSAQAENLKLIAEKEGLFILDGVWTRFLPSTKQIQRLILEEKIVGDVHRVSADLSHDCEFNSNGRLFHPGLGGGVLFDNLIYSISWTDLLLLKQAKEEPVVTSWSLKSKEIPEIDVTTQVSLVFSALNAVGTASGSFEVESPADSVLVEGKKGYLKINKASRPTKATFVSSKDQKETQLELESFPGLGYYFEANVAAVSIAEGLSSPREHPLEQTIRLSKIFDQVKLNNGITYPASVESV